MLLDNRICCTCACRYCALAHKECRCHCATTQELNNARAPNCMHCTHLHEHKSLKEALAFCLVSLLFSQGVADSSAETDHLQCTWQNREPPAVPQAGALNHQGKATTSHWLKCVATQLINKLDRSHCPSSSTASLHSPQWYK